MENWSVLSLWMTYKILYNKRNSATVCFILRTEWHHHVVTSLHARACSFLLFGLWGCFEVNVEKIMKCLKWTCCGLIFLMEWIERVGECDARTFDLWRLRLRTNRVRGFFSAFQWQTHFKCYNVSNLWNENRYNIGKDNKYNSSISSETTFLLNY